MLTLQQPLNQLPNLNPPQNLPQNPPQNPPPLLNLKQDQELVAIRTTKDSEVVPTGTSQLTNLSLNPKNLHRSAVTGAACEQQQVTKNRPNYFFSILSQNLKKSEIE